MQHKTHSIESRTEFSTQCTSLSLGFSPSLLNSTLSLDSMKEIETLSLELSPTINLEANTKLQTQFNALSLGLRP